MSVEGRKVFLAFGPPTKPKEPGSLVPSSLGFSNVGAGGNEKTKFFILPFERLFWKWEKTTVGVLLEGEYLLQNEAKTLCFTVFFDHQGAEN